MRPRSHLAPLAALLLAASATAGVGTTRTVTHDGPVEQGLALIPRFDPTLGRLERVHVTLQVATEGGLGFENLGAGRNFVAADFGAHARVLAPGGAELVEALTAPVECDHALSPFDGIVDLAGPSGESFAGLAAAGTGQRTLQADPVWVAGLAAQGEEIALTVEATDVTSVTGTGPLVVRRAQAIGTALVVTYEYTPGDT